MGSSGHGSETILVVDDDSVVRALCVEVLTGAGYNVLAAQDGFSALELCKAAPNPVDLALVDVRMPKISGPELIELLDCVVPLNLGIRFILMSGFADPATLQMAAGNERRCTFIQKPFKPSALLEVVRSELDTAQFRHNAGS